MKLLATALLALLAVAEAKPVAEEKKGVAIAMPPPNVKLGSKMKGYLGGECSDITLITERTGDGDRDNKYLVEATCGGGDNHSSAVVRLNLDDCLKNNNGRLNWGKEG